MKAYVVTTGVIFGLLVVMHVWRALAEGMSLAREPIFIAFTLVSAALSAWACGLILRSRRAPET